VPPTFLSGRVPPNETWRLEQFSRAYVKAVAAAAGCTYGTSLVDNDALDLNLKRATTYGRRWSPQLDVQLKATTEDCVKVGHVAYELDVPTYDKLRSLNYGVPRILVVVVMPEEIQSWLSHSEASLSLFHCGYWLSLAGQPAVANAYNRTVHLPRTNKFDAAGLDGIFARLSNAEDL